MKSFFVALQFLTRLQIVNQKKWTVEDFGASVPYFPAIGYIIGGATAFIYFLSLEVFSSDLAALLAVAFQFFFTGGLHADGFMDTCDGLFSGRDKDRKLEIMKDSRVGSNGVMGFIFLVACKWQFLAHTLPMYVPFLLFITSVFSKFGLVYSIRAYPYARPEGMGKAFVLYSSKYSILISLFLSFIPLIFVYELWLPYTILFAISLAVNMIVNHYVVKHLGGVTGDTYGFVSESTELVLFFVYAFIFSIY